MDSDPKPRRPSNSNGLHIVAAIVLVAAAVTAGISLSHPTHSEDTSGAYALAPSAAAPAMAPAHSEIAGADPSLPAAGDALRDNRSAGGDDATTF